MKEFIESLFSLERGLFFSLNGSNSLFLDNAMWTISGRFIWIPLILFIIYIFFSRLQRKEAILLTIVFILLFVMADQISSGIIKPYFKFFRPTHNPDFKDFVETVNNYTGGKYGFISGHATNSFAIAVFLSLVFRNRWVTLSTLLWATTNSYTRIYLGVHFITDVTAGMIVGTLIAIFLYIIYAILRKTILHPPSSRRKTPFVKSEGTVLAVSIVLYIAIIVIFCPVLSSLPH